MKNELNKLIKRWETRAMSCDVAAGNAAGSGDYTTETRNKIRAGLIRQTIAELKQEIEADDQRKKHHDDFAHSLSNCPDCGKFRNFGHVCEPKTNT
jgi:hypothetical protein